MFFGADAALGYRVRGLAEEMGLGFAEAPSSTEAPSVVVIGLDQPEAVEDVRRWRRRHPDLVIAAYLSVPQRDRWEAAERAGADLVVNRGALVRSLRRVLSGLEAGATARKRIPLFDAGEVAGRLGLIQAVDDTPVGPVAVYRSGASLVGIANVCPHAGATLSDGPYEDGILTCPAHGSRFDVATGERVRGPADQGLRTYTVVEEEGRVWLLWL
ncbi:MAG: Rieske (2Fe-2S) protein [Acidimicrobiales bacterium]